MPIRWKKPVNFGFLDFTSLEKRRYFCEQEILLNRRLAPEGDLGVVPIAESDGEISYEGKRGTVNGLCGENGTDP